MDAFNYMHLGNIELLEEMYESYLKNPLSVDSSWKYFFEGVEFGKYQEEQKKAPSFSDDWRIDHLIRAYRKYGHLKAQFNPINTEPTRKIPELEIERLHFQQQEGTQLFPTYGLLSKEKATLNEIIEVLETIYCSKIGIEYVGLQTPALEEWIQKQVEPNRFRPSLSIDEKKGILTLLNQAELFETFLHTKYVGQKRFSLEGGETLIPILGEIIERGAALGIEEFVLGMSHRGRLNVLANVLKKSFSMIFSEFEDYIDPNLVEGAGDVKYHQGFSSTITTAQGHIVHTSLTSNPSHLESVNPVVEGKTRAKQTRAGDIERKKIIPLLIHGDSSLAGQGVVYETLQLHKLKGYSTGGTIHIVVNNQIGFTTLPEEYGSTRYCTDIAKGFGFPVFHVNAEDPEGSIYAAKLALEIRNRFQCDVFIEMNCYRKYGHNEGDEPAFTQPIEYQLIRQKKSIRELYRDQLIHEGILEKEMALGLEEEFKKALHFELEELKITKEIPMQESFGGTWKEYHKATKAELLSDQNTGVDLAILKEIGEATTTLPNSFQIHKKLLKWIEERRKMVEGERPIDWAMAEHLAFGSLLYEAVPVRLSGQDCQRGTFTQRHAVWVDQESGKRYFPLAHIKENQALFEVYNSSLSEFGILGFEFGYSLAYPETLTLWEAQFGDFANGAQVIFDQYLTASVQKWQRYSGLTVLLPHGYEGQGSEHSSARLERYLQQAAESNIQVVYPTTPAQYFHLLRRQMKRPIRVPLIVMSPKGLLRYGPCSSALEDLTQGRFLEVIDDPAGNRDATRILLCSGRIYYDLIAYREEQKIGHCAILRIEQLYPFHQDALKELLGKYSAAKEYLWVQEEPQNMGAFNYVLPLLQKILPKKAGIHYVGREKSASTATGSHRRHAQEFQQLMQKAYANLY